ncbi:hypothetical protein MJ564_00175 [Escherichia coli]|nr:hypothetical protein MJ564_00175 [Escherichia coli]
MKESEINETAGNCLPANNHAETICIFAGVLSCEKEKMEENEIESLHLTRNGSILEVPLIAQKQMLLM